MKQAQSWRCQMEQQASFQEYLIFLTSSPEGVWVIFVLSLIFVAGIKYFGQEFFRWLKGSRKNYALREDFLCECSFGDYCWAENIIKISRLFFWSRGIIYGKAFKNWKISRVSLGLDTNVRFGSERVSLVDSGNLSTEQALKLINTYSSLQSMLDRISELERDNWLSAKKYNDLNAALIAIYKHILDDKQRFRSQAAQEIRENLELILKETHCIYDGAVEKSWRTRFNRGKIPSGA